MNKYQNTRNFNHHLNITQKAFFFQNFTLNFSNGRSKYFVTLCCDTSSDDFSCVYTDTKPAPSMYESKNAVFYNNNTRYGVTAVTPLVWLNWLTSAQPSHSPQKKCN